MPNDKTKIDEELAMLQLEESRFRVQELRSQQEHRRVRRESIESSIRNEAAQRAATQNYCWHKKGGMGVENIHHGNDNNYAIIRHQYAHGPIDVFCIRCGKQWSMPKPLKRGASAEDRAKYIHDLAEYNKAMAFPTDNTMSGSQLFAFTPVVEPMSEAV